MGAEVTGDMRGSEVIYPGPARIVLAAATQLRDPDLTERYSEEWLANLRGRTYLQQWRDAVSLLLRGARATRCACHGTDHSRPRVVVASQATMALILAIGTILLYTMMPSYIISVDFMVPGNEVASWGYPPILAISLTAAGAIGLALLARRSWPTALGWLSIGILTTQTLASSLTHRRCFFLPGEGRVPHLGFVLDVTYFTDARTWWVVTASYWVLYAALTLFVSRKIPPVMRVLAASEVVVILYSTSPDWAYQYADRLGLIGLVRWLVGLLHVPTSEGITALRVTPGIGFLVSMLIIMAAWRCVVIARSLVLLSRRGPSGARICPR